MKLPSSIGRNKKIALILILLIILLAGFLRFYRMREYTTFLGDEGRDMLVVKRMIVDKKFTLLGPITSVGSMYMGPVYYYFMLPFLWAWRLDPVGPSVMVGLFSLATVALIYLTLSEFFTKRSALLASLFYSVSPLTIIYGRSSWNPNIVPFFTLLVIYSLLKVTVKKQYLFLVLALFSMGIVIQLHYVSLLMVPVIIACIILTKTRITLKITLFAAAAFILGYSPFLLFEIRHGFVNLQAVFRFIFSEKGDFSIRPIKFFLTGMDILVRLFWRLLIVVNAEISKALIVIMAIFYYRMLKTGNLSKRNSLRVILTWFGIGTIAYAFYRGVLYDYYLGSLFAVPFILFAVFIGSLHKMGGKIRVVSMIISFMVLGFMFSKNPHYVGPNNMLKNTEEISRFILDKTGNKPYNFALLTGQNSDHAYRYFLEISGNPPKTIENPVIDPERKSVTDQLLIVCEEKVCKPLGHPLWEIAGFGRAEIDGEWDVVTVKVFRMIHYEEK